jgi:hypothetical protein
MSRVGKLAWYWNALNARALDLLETLPGTHWRVVRLEDLNYSKYLEVVAFFGLRSQVPDEKYQAIAKSRPNRYVDVPTIADWGDREIEEFQQQVAPMAEWLGYPWRFKDLPTKSKAPPARIHAWRRRCRRMLKDWLGR